MTFTSEGSILEWRGEGETLRIEPWGTDSVRIRSSKKMPISEQNWGLLGEHHEPGQAVRVEISEDQSLATLTNGNITVTAHAFKEGNAGAGHTESLCELSFSKADGTELFQEMPQHGALKLHARKFSPTDGGNQRIEATFLSPENEHLYGMGEYQQSYMDLKGCSFELAHRNSQASIPFVVSSAGYGFLWNNPAIGTAEFSKNRTWWVAESSRQLDYWVTAGNEPAEIERHYADATGHAPKMPEWGLGFWQCKLRYWNQNQVLEVAREFKRRNIPIDVLVIDFFHWPHMGDFRFEEEFWPNPKAMCEELHSMGIKVMVSVWPQISLRSENYEHMLENGLLVSAEHGIDIANMYQEPNQFYDATNPKAQASFGTNARTTTPIWEWTRSGWTKRNPNTVLTISAIIGTIPARTSPPATSTQENTTADSTKANWPWVAKETSSISRDAHGWDPKNTVPWCGAATFIPHSKTLRHRSPAASTWAWPASPGSPPTWEASH